MNLTTAASWLQHSWCLYICWTLQLPAIASLAVIIVLASALRSGPPEITEEIGLTLFGLMVFLYICQPILYFMDRLTPTRMLWIQVFESAFMMFIGSPIIPGKNFWRMSDFTAWTVVYTCCASFCVLQARSVLVWYQSRKESEGSIALEDGAKMGDTLKDANCV